MCVPAAAPAPAAASWPVPRAALPLPRASPSPLPRPRWAWWPAWHGRLRLACSPAWTDRQRPASPSSRVWSQPAAASWPRPCWHTRALRRCGSGSSPSSWSFLEWENGLRCQRPLAEPGAPTFCVSLASLFSTKGMGNARFVSLWLSHEWGAGPSFFRVTRGGPQQPHRGRYTRRVFARKVGLSGWWRDGFRTSGGPPPPDFTTHSCGHTPVQLGKVGLLYRFTWEYRTPPCLARPCGTSRPRTWPRPRQTSAGCSTPPWRSTCG